MRIILYPVFLYPKVDSMPNRTLPPADLTTSRILQTWWPLALGWLIMNVEMPVLSAFVARMFDPKHNLAAWGIVVSLAMILASPVMMMLSASTALSKDWASYCRVRRYMFVIAGGLTLLHALMVFTPLFDWVVIDVMGAPLEIVESIRMGLTIMLPWCIPLAFRRLNYGVLIRFGHQSAITVGAIIRLSVEAVVVGILFSMGTLPGVALAAVSMSCGVIAEGIYAGWRVAPILQSQVRPAPPVEQPLTAGTFSRFYIPLVMTSLLQIIVQPLVSSALSRMPNPIETLAVWPVVYGILVIFMSVGFAYTETVVVLLDEPNAKRALQRFTFALSAVIVGLLLVMALTPLAGLWFRNISSLPESLITPAVHVLTFGAVGPGLLVLQSWFQGILLHRRKTRGITEAMALGLLANALILWIGVRWGGIPGLWMGMGSYVFSSIMRAAWLSIRARTPAVKPSVGLSVAQDTSPALS